MAGRATVASLSGRSDATSLAIIWNLVLPVAVVVGESGVYAIRIGGTRATAPVVAPGRSRATVDSSRATADAGARRPLVEVG